MKCIVGAPWSFAFEIHTIINHSSNSDRYSQLVGCVWRLSNISVRNLMALWQFFLLHFFYVLLLRYKKWARIDSFFVVVVVILLRASSLALSIFSKANPFFFVLSKFCSKMGETHAIHRHFSRHILNSMPLLIYAIYKMITMSHWKHKIFWLVNNV